MTYEHWVKQYFNKVKDILMTKQDEQVENIIDYFDYSNMSEQEQGFCPLYRNFTKCHVTDKLNCLLCACPYFRYSSDEPLSTNGTNKVMSICSIGSKQASTYTIDGVTHCDCSKCTIPHSKQHIKSLTKDVVDSYSLLELVRNYQMESCFGKYKLF